MLQNINNIFYTTFQPQTLTWSIAKLKKKKNTKKINEKVTAMDKPKAKKKIHHQDMVKS